MRSGHGITRRAIVRAARRARHRWQPATALLVERHGGRPHRDGVAVSALPPVLPQHAAWHHLADEFAVEPSQDLQPCRVAVTHRRLDREFRPRPPGLLATVTLQAAPRPGPVRQRIAA